MPTAVFPSVSTFLLGAAALVALGGDAHATPLVSSDLSLAWQGASAAGCTKDTECKGDRICSQGICVDPEPRAAALPSPPVTSAPPTPSATLLAAHSEPTPVHTPVPPSASAAVPPAAPGVSAEAPAFTPSSPHDLSLYLAAYQLKGPDIYVAGAVAGLGAKVGHSSALQLLAGIDVPFKGGGQFGLIGAAFRWEKPDQKGTIRYRIGLGTVPAIFGGKVVSWGYQARADVLGSLATYPLSFGVSVDKFASVWAAVYRLGMAF